MLISTVSPTLKDSPGGVNARSRVDFRSRVRMSQGPMCSEVGADGRILNGTKLVLGKKSLILLKNPALNLKGAVNYHNRFFSVNLMGLITQQQVHAGTIPDQPPGERPIAKRGNRSACL